MTLIGAHGKLGSGKDALYERIAHLAKVPVRRVSYADKLKDSACALLGITREQMEDLKRNEDFHAIQVFEPAGTGWRSGVKGMTMRTFLQRFGTESHRDIFGQNFWLDAALPLDTVHDGMIIVVTDVRFPNEAQRIYQLGGLIWQVLGVDDDTGDHVSEAPLPQEIIDEVIRNNVRDDDFATLDYQIRVHLGDLVKSRAEI